MELKNCGVINYLKSDPEDVHRGVVENPFDKGLINNIREMFYRNIGWHFLRPNEPEEISPLNYFNQNQIEKVTFEYRSDVDTTNNNSQEVPESNSMIDTSGNTGSTYSQEPSSIDLRKYFERLCRNYRVKFYYPDEQVIYSVLQISCPVQRKVLKKLQKKITKLGLSLSSEELA